MTVHTLRLIHSPTPNWSEVRSFYREVLGLEETGGWDLPGDRGAFLAAGTAEIEVMEQDLRAAGVLDDAPGGWCLALEVEDLDAEWQRLSAAGVPAVRMIRQHAWGSRDFVVRDPAGNAVIIFSQA